MKGRVSRRSRSGLHSGTVSPTDSLDKQFAKLAPTLSDELVLPSEAWPVMATLLFENVRTLESEPYNSVLARMPLHPQSYLDELTASSKWSKWLDGRPSLPWVTRTDILARLYLAFVWLRDSVLDPLADVVQSDAALMEVIAFLVDGECRALRNAVAHGRWGYLPDFTGLEFWPQRPDRCERRTMSEERFNVLHDFSVLTSWSVLLGLVAHAEAPKQVRIGGATR